jgi:hypothetical protein
MHSTFLIASLLAAYGMAIPLNINLGAYSPALVVGDGEISFGGKADVTNLMNALEGAAVSGAAANGAAAQPAVEGQQAAQIASLQGMGKEIAPRVVKLEEKGEVLKRDLSGFDRALKYAADAIKTTPEIDLGTEAAGVGILQRPGITAAQAGGAKPAAAQAPAQAKRDAPTPKMKTTVTTMFVRGGPAPAGKPTLPMTSLKLQLTIFSVVKERATGEAPVAKRAPSPGLDGVNLNMAEGQVAELTFVETRAVDETEDEE